MNHIGVYDNVISKEGCRKIIKYFEDSSWKERAYVIAGSDTKEINPKFKNGSNLTVRLSDCDKFMYDSLNEYILPALGKGLGEYKKKFPFINHGLDAWSIDDAFNIQKFDGKKEGYFVQHCESSSRNCDRMLVWMIYLNNAKCGTRFYYPTRDVKAKEGRLVLWPAGWTHPHSGILPNIGEKYMITGWYSFD